MDSFLLPTGYNHMFMVQKIGRGFEYHGFKTKIVSRIREINGPGVVMLCDHPVYYSFGSRHNRNGNALRLIPGIISRIDRKIKIFSKVSMYLQCIAYKKLAEQVKNKNIFVIVWNITDKRKEFLDKLGIPIIFTSEYYGERPKTPYPRVWYDLYTNKKNKNCMPLRFGADVDPKAVGRCCKNSRYIIAYVGDKSYIRRYADFFEKRNVVKIVATPPYISEAEKVAIYKNSMMILGLTSEQSKRDNHVPERIFESLAFGAICLTDSMSAVKQTEGCAIYFRNKEDLKEKIEKFKSDKKIRELLRQRSFDYIKTNGTWASRAKDFINLANKLYRINLK